MDKTPFIAAYFDEFEKKVNRLPTLVAAPFQDEALTLCVAYIDALASAYYYDHTEANKRNFCRALCELSGDISWGMIHPRQLTDLANKKGKDIGKVLEKLASQVPSRFLTTNEVSECIQSSSLQKTMQTSMIENLWRASVAAICYERVRCPAIHGPGVSATLTFDGTEYESRLGMQIDFKKLQMSLLAILTSVRKISLDSGLWFGNAVYERFLA